MLNLLRRADRCLHGGVTDRPDVREGFLVQGNVLPDFPFRGVNGNPVPDPQKRLQQLSSFQGHRKVDEAVKILLTANSGEERLAMKSGFFESAPVGS